MDAEALEFTKLCLEGKLNHRANLALLYYLQAVGECSVSEAAVVTRVQRGTLYYELLPANPLFESQMVSGLGFQEGYRRRLLRLTPTAKAYLDNLMALAEKMLGVMECQLLTAAAEKARKENARGGAGFEAWLEEKKELVRQNPKIIIEAIAEAAPKYGGTIKEALEVLRNARG